MLEQDVKVFKSYTLKNEDCSQLRWALAYTPDGPLDTIPDWPQELDTRSLVAVPLTCRRDR